MNYQKGEFLYEGKAKRMYAVQNHDHLVWIEFKDSLTAFNAQKKGSFAKKGVINCEIATLIFKFLKKNSVASHWVANMSDHEMVCEKLTIIPLEVVVRNRLAGSTAKKFGIEEGRLLKAPLVEFYYKDDALGDPFISDDQALALDIVESRSTLEELKAKALQVNENLKKLFSGLGIELIDFKLEFGRASGQGNFKANEILLADEITPDSCRLWDQKTGEKLDKDRFRRDLGKIEESYQEVLSRLQRHMENQI